MRFSMIVNTCALADHAQVVTGSTTRTPHAVRSYALHHFIIPAYVAAFDEVIVVGEWMEGEDYTYIHAPSVYKSAVDALHQRQAAAEAASGDILIFAHDDHFLETDVVDTLKWWEADVWVPRRMRREAKRCVRLTNGGEGNDGYIGGHCAIYKRKAIEAAPWGDVEKVHVWDTKHTDMLKAANMKIEWNDDMVVWDVEVEG